MNMKKVQRFGSMSKLAIDLTYLKHIKKVPANTLGKFTKERFSKMGPTFIKIGQFLSTRSDIFGADFTRELKGLQDNIDPFEYNIGSLPSAVKLNNKPIATASIGQVYKGVLVTGEEIAVKVKRPKIEDNINIDFEAFLSVIDIASIISSQREIYELSTIVNEYYNLLKEEIDFSKEVENMIKFRTLFKNKKYIKVPKVFKELSNDNVIVMEYVEAIRIDDISTLNSIGFNRKKITEKLVEVFLEQILEFGIIHIDPHPGNVGVTKNGKIVFYDYGMIQVIGIDFKRDLKNILLAVYDKNVDYLCELFIKSNIVIVDRSQIAYLKNFVLALLSYIDNLNVLEFKENYIDKIDSRALPFTISSKFLLILRGISILEGVCKTLDPTFNYRENIDKYINDGLIDVDYIERKAIIDIDSMTSMPDKVTKNQIQLELIEKNVQRIEDKIEPRNARMIVLLALVFAFDMFEDIYIKMLLAIVTFMSLYK